MSKAAQPFLLPVGSLARREIVRFLRQRSRIVGALATPLLFWVLLGTGFGSSFRPPGAAESQSYLTYFYPGTVLLVVLFTSIFSCISIVEDRREGFLQSVLVSPVRPEVIVAGKILGSTGLALMQGAVLLVLAPVIGMPLSLAGLAISLAVLTITSLAMSAIGFVFAWRLNSVQGFHAIMNLILMPMWMLSGALFPASGAMSWTGRLMAANPLNYALAAMRRSMQAGSSAGLDDLPSMALCWAVLLATAAVAFVFAARCVSDSARRAAAGA